MDGTDMSSPHKPEAGKARWAHPNTPRVDSAWRQQQDTQRREERAQGTCLQLAQPHPQGCLLLPPSSSSQH